MVVRDRGMLGDHTVELLVNGDGGFLKNPISSSLVALSLK